MMPRAPKHESEYYGWARQVLALLDPATPQSALTAEAVAIEELVPPPFAAIAGEDLVVQSARAAVAPTLLSANYDAGLLSLLWSEPVTATALPASRLVVMSIGGSWDSDPTSWTNSASAFVTGSESGGFVVEPATLDYGGSGGGGSIVSVATGLPVAAFTLFPITVS